MTTIMSPDGPAEVINARRTESLDAPAILKLVQPSTEALFGRVNVVNLIEKAVLAVTLNNDKEEILGHAAFLDYPNVPGVDPADWETWLNQFYECKNCSALNSVFLHYFVAKPEYSHGCAKEIVRTMFNAVPELHYCFLVVPVGVYPESALAGLFTEMDRLEPSKSPRGCVVFACHRHDHVPVLHIRHARVEDHDDLTPIFNRQSEMLLKAYGDYFLAELIDSQDDQMHCLVAEVDGTAVGFMSVSEDVNLDLINECYEVGPFHGFRKPCEDDVLEPSESPRAESIRPGSAASAKSAASNISVSKKSQSSAKSNRTKSQSGSRPGSSSSHKSGKGVTGEETKIKQRLSDDPVVEGTGSASGDLDDVASIKSEASERELQQKPPELEDAEIPQTAATLPKTPKPASPRAILSKRFVPTYKGEQNAFSIQLFCIDERFEMRSMDFLPKVFELFPEMDFCIITVPHMVPEFALLQNFVRVTPRCPSTLSQELYAFGRAGLLHDFKVRKACKADLGAVNNLVKELHMQERLVQDLQQFYKAKRDDDGTEIQAFVAEANNQVVGVAILRREEDIEYIRSHYNIEDFIYFNHHARTEHGHLHHYALNPNFNHYSKLFLKEILRLGHKTCLYYPLYPPYAEKELTDTHTLVGALHAMVPVRARRQIVYPLKKLGGNAPSERVLKEQEPYALNHINRKLTLEPKVTINARIVVVGASDTGISFLETLTFCPHLRFNNLTVISPHGIPGELPPDQLRDQVLGKSMCYTQEEYANISLRSMVNSVYGKMTAIDRKKKHVVVNHSTVVPYDHLVLCTGTQYQIAAPTGADISKLVTNSEVPNSPDRRIIGPSPKNVFVINDAYESAVALYWLENNILYTKGHMIVYGNTLDAYCCVQAMLSFGISGDRITLVEPPLNYKTSCFNNATVEQAVLTALKEAGVEVYSGYILAQWNDGEEGDEIYAASFTSATKPIRFECAAFFCFYARGIDNDAFKAINNACLVFDGHLVIDSNFHTNDVSIRAAGPLTKFQRSYHADQWTHANFNSKEVGIQLASTMLSLFDPTLEPEREPPKDLLKLIPMYRSPKVQGGILPGGYHYLHVAKPSLNIPLEVQMAQSDFGKELITGTPGGNPEYFRLHINEYSSVETITCLAKTEFAASNILCLYGLHERYLNDLLSRIAEGLIKDFYAYFQEPWSLALYHDRFADFRDEVREQLIMRPSPESEALEEKVRRMIEEDLQLGPDQRKLLQKEYANSGAKRAVETRLLSFLTYNYYHLPMYAKPGMV